jgi:hypothetical protein
MPDSTPSWGTPQRKISSGKRHSNDRFSKLSVNTCSFQKDSTVEEEDLVPFSSPSKELDIAIFNLLSDQWEAQLSGIISIRRLARFHSNVLIDDIHQIVMLLTSFVNNLRSTLSKNAIICYDDLFKNIGRVIDSDLELIVPSLMKKTAEANHFINNEAEKTLLTIVRNSNPEKVIVSILRFSDQKSASIRASSAMLLNECVEIYQASIFRSKEIGKLLNCICRFLNDSSFESRRWGRLMAYNLSNMSNSPAEFDNILRRHLSDSKYKEFKEAAKKNPSQATTPTNSATTTRIFFRNKSAGSSPTSYSY